MSGGRPSAEVYPVWVVHARLGGKPVGVNAPPAFLLSPDCPSLLDSLTLRRPDGCYNLFQAARERGLTASCAAWLPCASCPAWPASCAATSTSVIGPVPLYLSRYR